MYTVCFSCVWLQYTPREKDALHHVEVLHQHISLRLGAQVAHCVTDAQLDGTFQGRGCGLWKEGVREAEGDVVREILAPSLTLTVNERSLSELEQIISEEKTHLSCFYHLKSQYVS